VVYSALSLSGSIVTHPSQPSFVESTKLSGLRRASRNGEAAGTVIRGPRPGRSLDHDDQRPAHLVLSERPRGSPSKDNESLYEPDLEVTHSHPGVFVLERTLDNSIHA
jgi:hypothetical protein